MNTLTVLRLDRDRELTGDIVPETYFRCQALRELTYPWASNDFERQLTEVRAAWTDKFLYFHLWAKDSWIVGRETKPKGRVYEDDCLEVFLMPGGDRYWGWEINPLGTQLDYLASGWGEGPVEEKHIDSSWKSVATRKVRAHDAGWVVELRIPLAKDLEQAPRRGQTWNAAFNRIDVDRQGRSSLSTSSTLAADGPVWFHQPPGFGQLVFG